MKQLPAQTIQTQLNGEDVFIDVGLLRWLNEQSGPVARDNWLLSACLFFLTRLRVHGRIRLDEDGHKKDAPAGTSFYIIATVQSYRQEKFLQWMLNPLPHPGWLHGQRRAS